MAVCDVAAVLIRVAMVTDEVCGLDENEKESGIDSESDSGNDDSAGGGRSSSATAGGPDDVILRRKKKASAGGGASPHDIVTQLARRQSFQHVDFMADDIDAFIASVTVPPPPKDDFAQFQILPDMPKILTATKPSSPAVAAKPSRPGVVPNRGVSGGNENVTVVDPSGAALGGESSWRELLGSAAAPLPPSLDDDDFAKYVIPPPDSESNELDLAAIPIVLPPTLSPADTPTDTPTDSPRSADSHGTSSTIVVSSAAKLKPSAANKPISQPSMPTAKPNTVSKPALPPSMPPAKPPVTRNSMSPTTGQPKPSMNKPNISLPPKPSVSDSSVNAAATVKPNTSQNEPVKVVSAKPTTKPQVQPTKPKPANLQDSAPVKSTHAKQQTPTVERVPSGSSESSLSSMTSSNSGGVFTKSSPGSAVPGVTAVVRPSVSPTKPVIDYNRSRSHTDIDTRHSPKIAPPAPPKRHSSLDVSEQPPSRRRVASADIELSASGGVSAYMRSKSAENSPVHALSTLGRGKKRAPPPPPRRTSALTGSAEMHELSRSAVDGLHVQPPKFSTFGPQQGKAYQQMFGNKRGTAAASASTTSDSSSIFTMFRNKPLQPSGSSQPAQNDHTTHAQAERKETHDYSAALGTGASTQAQKTTQARTILKAQGSSGGRDDVRGRANSNSSDSVTDSPRSRAKFVSPSIQAKQNAIATAFNHQQPPTSTVASTRHSDVSSSSASPSSTPSPSRHGPAAAASSSPRVGSSTIPRAYTSPQTSPALQRHTSFSKAADSSAEPFKTFRGDTAAAAGAARNSASPKGSPRQLVSLIG